MTSNRTYLSSCFLAVSSCFDCPDELARSDQEWGEEPEDGESLSDDDSDDVSFLLLCLSFLSFAHCYPKSKSQEEEVSSSGTGNLRSDGLEEVWVSAAPFLSLSFNLALVLL
jgi:hypothetical protein